MSTSRARQQRRRNVRTAKKAKGRESKLPTCPICTNKIAEGDGTPVSADGPVIHKACVERLQRAKEIQTAQRVQEGGLWLPGQD